MASLSLIPLLSPAHSSTEIDLILNQSLNIDHTNIPNQGLKVVWWNIGCGLETSEIKTRADRNTTNLELNLIRFSESEYKPDVLIIGEFCPYTMSNSDQAKLKSLYRNNIHIERNIPQFRTSSGGINQRNGFLILSDSPIDLVSDEVLSATADFKESRDDRRFIVFKLQKNNKFFYINPVHLVNPWRAIYASKGVLGTAAELTSGDSNPNALQIKNLIAKINEFKIQNLPFLTIGDFNSPGSIYGFSGYGFSLMSRNMTKLRDGYDITFLGDGPFPETDIDHAFGLNVKSTYNAVWPLEGSRHLPIYLVIDEL
jgi:endonuclease/exonuclease/phosphatase family metal-dependent hydrolase